MVCVTLLQAFTTVAAGLETEADVVLGARPLLIIALEKSGATQEKTFIEHLLYSRHCPRA